MRDSSSDLVRQVVCLILSNLCLEDDEIVESVIQQSCFHDALWQVLNAVDTTLYCNAEFVLVNFLLSAHAKRIF